MTDFYDRMPRIQAPSRACTNERTWYDYFRQVVVGGWYAARQSCHRDNNSAIYALHKARAMAWLCEHEDDPDCDAPTFRKVWPYVTIPADYTGVLWVQEDEPYDGDDADEVNKQIANGNMDYKCALFYVNGELVDSLGCVTLSWNDRHTEREIEADLVSQWLRTEQKAEAFINTGFAL